MVIQSFVGPPRIELGLYAPEAYVIPLYHGPARDSIASARVGLPGIEPGLHPPHGRVLPVYYSPSVDSRDERNLTYS